MIKIRLARGGTKNKPFYRIVAIEESRKREGKPQDILGYWHPAKDTKKIDKKKLKFWIERGAKVTKAVEKLL
ncbi:30S ribosomal protein S16 [Candidatus Woesebacteria bacterium]|jgi:small subunit ribosomal protein S16|nr:MAG: 30S ribosomal protein S16 [Candidatus Woesebacteria bacterium]